MEAEKEEPRRVSFFVTVCHRLCRAVVVGCAVGADGCGYLDDASEFPDPLDDGMEFYESD